MRLILTILGVCTASSPDGIPTVDTHGILKGDGHQHTARMWNLLDRNKDGRLDRKEVERLKRKAAKLAANRGEAPPSDLFASLDTDADGAVSREEAEPFFQRVLAGGTRNHERVAKTRADEAAKRGRHLPRNSPHSDALARGDIAARLFHGLDANADGLLTREEMHPVLEKASMARSAEGRNPIDYFAELDHNTDGLVDFGEANHFLESLGSRPGKTEL